MSTHPVTGEEGGREEPVVIVIGGVQKMGLPTVQHCIGVKEWL